MPVTTTVGLKTADLANQFNLDPNNLAGLENAVMNVLNGPPHHMGVTVRAEVEAQGRAVTFRITAPVALDPPTVKAALR
jgi:hypothetical protein